MKPVDGNSNIASSEKKTQGSLRMNIDARLYNKEARHTRDSQKGKQVQVQARRRSSDLESKERGWPPCSRLEERGWAVW